MIWPAVCQNRYLRISLITLPWTSVRWLALHFVLGYEFLPSREDRPFVLKKREKRRRKSLQLRLCRARGHAQTVNGDWTCGDNPKLVEILRNECWNVIAGSQQAKRLNGFGVLRVFGVHPPRADIGIEENVHRPRSP